MILSVNWLREYVELPQDISPEQLSHDITMATVEVEEVIDQRTQFEHMVVGKIEKLEKHPNADKLQLAHTNVGADTHQIVCGGTNLQEGMLVAVALPGACVRWHGEGDLVTLEPAEIRGEKSHGMICAAAEIGLEAEFPSDDERSIVDLSHLEAAPGTPLAEALGYTDILIDIDNKSLTNRPDLWCHYGMARELAALYQCELRPLTLSDLPKATADIKLAIKASEAVYGYNALVVDAVQKAHTPDWMRKRLVSCGLRPIHPLVDITNYVMLEVGEPTHAFDTTKLTDNTIVVRSATQDESLLLLGDVDALSLSAEDVVIADSKKALALAGVKGGQESGVTSATERVVFEAATFDPLVVRRMATRHRLRTEASQRHEKGLDTQRAVLALQRIMSLLEDVCPDAVVHGLVQESIAETKQPSITVAHETIVSRIGQDIPEATIVDYLQRLGFGVTVEAATYTITVPTWRATGDVSIPEDIVEEVARLYGYDNLATVYPNVQLRHAVYQPHVRHEHALKVALATQGRLNEVITYPWMTDSDAALFSFDESTCFALAAPPAADQRLLAPSLLPNIRQVVLKNIKQRNAFGVFQIARVFTSKNYTTDAGEVLPEQPKHLACAVVGDDGEAALLELKGIVLGALNRIGYSVSIDSASNAPAYWQSGHVASIQFAAKNIGFLGSLISQANTEVNNQQKSVAYAEIDLSFLFEQKSTAAQYQPLPQYPRSERDIAIEIDRSVAWKAIQDVVYAASPLALSCELFDVYTGSHIAADKKSMAFRISFGSDDHTLLSEEIDAAEQKIVSQLEKSFTAKRRE